MTKIEVPKEPKWTVYTEEEEKKNTPNRLIYIENAMRIQ